MFVWDVSPTIIELGPIKLRYYGLLFASMLMGGFYLFRWQVLRGGYTEKQADRFLLLDQRLVILMIPFACRAPVGIAPLVEEESSQVQVLLLAGNSI